MGERVAKDMVVEIHYTLTNEAGEVLDSSRDGDPMMYLHGAGNIVPGLEKQLLGRSPGDSFTAIVPPAEGYGLREPDALMRAPRSAFPADMDLEEGTPLWVEDDDGAEHPAWIAEVSDSAVVLDRNHPLAGVTLKFAVEVMTVRKATAEEKAHGHVHSGDGHHH